MGFSLVKGKGIEAEENGETAVAVGFSFFFSGHRVEYTYTDDNMFLVYIGYEVLYGPCLVLYTI